VSITSEHRTQWQCMTPARHTKSFPLFHNHYFNISGLLPCCNKNEKKMSFCGGPLFGWTCLNPPLILVMAILLYVPNSCSWLTVRVMCSYFCFIIWLLGLQKYHTLSIKIYSCCIARHGELHWSYTWVRAISSKKRWLINYIFCNVNEDC